MSLIDARQYVVHHNYKYWQPVDGIREGHMKSLFLEGTQPLTRMEVKDWLFSVGAVAYEVHLLPIGDPTSSKEHRFLVKTSDTAARHILTRPPGQKIGQSVITVKIDNSN